MTAGQKDNDLSCVHVRVCVSLCVGVCTFSPPRDLEDCINVTILRHMTVSTKKTLMTPPQHKQTHIHKGSLHHTSLKYKLYMCFQACDCKLASSDWIDCPHIAFRLCCANVYVCVGCLIVAMAVCVSKCVGLSLNCVNSLVEFDFECVRLSPRSSHA